MKLRSGVTSAFLGLLALGLSAAEVRVALPPGVQADWAYGPGPALPATARIVPSRDALWILARPRILANNRGQALVLLFDAQDFVADTQGRFWLCDGRAAGTLDPAPDCSAAALKTILLLPGAAWRLAGGGKQGPLAWGPDSEDGRSALIRLKDRRTLLRWPARLSAVADVPGGLVLATPTGLIQVDATGRAKALPLFQAVRALAWVTGVGLAASTLCLFPLLLLMLPAAASAARKSEGRLDANEAAGVEERLGADLAAAIRAAGAAYDRAAEALEKAERLRRQNPTALLKTLQDVREDYARALAQARQAKDPGGDTLLRDQVVVSIVQSLRACDLIMQGLRDGKEGPRNGPWIGAWVFRLTATAVTPAAMWTRLPEFANFVLPGLA